MGTEFERIVNPLADCTKTNILAGNPVNNREICRRREFMKMSGVQRLLEEGEVESIRNTMQIHEQVFNHQVKELHRLYCAQKNSMNELMKKINHQNSREYTGSCSGDDMRISKGFDLGRHVEEDISTRKNVIDEDQAGSSPGRDKKSKKMVKTRDSYDEDSEVELTLSIGGNPSKKRSKSSSPINFTSTFKTERGNESSDPTTPTSSSSATCDPDTKRSHWLFQSLKL